MRRENVCDHSVRRVGGEGLGSRAFFMERRNVVVFQSDWYARGGGSRVAGRHHAAQKSSSSVSESSSSSCMIFHPSATSTLRTVMISAPTSVTPSSARVLSSSSSRPLCILRQDEKNKGEAVDRASFASGAGRFGKSNSRLRLESCVWGQVWGRRGRGGGGWGMGHDHAREFPRFHESLKATERAASGGRPMVRATSARSFLGVSVEGSTSSSKSSSACVRVAMDVFQYRLHLSFCSRGLMSTFMWSSRLSGRVKASFGDRGVEVMSSLQPRGALYFHGANSPREYQRDSLG